MNWVCKVLLSALITVAGFFLLAAVSAFYKVVRFIDIIRKVPCDSENREEKGRDD